MKFIDDWKQRGILMRLDRRAQEARERFNIVRIDGNDFITFDGIIVSRPNDKDLLERLEEFRDKYMHLPKED